MAKGGVPAARPRPSVAEVLRALHDRHGGLTPNLVVATAQDPAHPLHGHFEWDDTVAAEAYRLDQARQLIQSIKVEVTYGDIVLLAPVYVRDPQKQPSEQGYVLAEGLRGQQHLALDVLEREIARITSAFERGAGAAVLVGIRRNWLSLARRTFAEFENILSKARDGKAR